MPRVSVEGSDLVVRLSLRERAAVRRREIRVPVSAVRQVGVESSWWRVLRGAPDRGVWHPGRCAGFRRLPEGGVDFVAVRAAGPVLVLDLDLGSGAPLRRIAVSVTDAEGARRALLAAMPGAPSADAPEVGPEAGPEQGAGDAGNGDAEPETAGGEDGEGAPVVHHRPALQHEGGSVDDHGRLPGAPSRTGTGAQPPAGDERVRASNRGTKRDRGVRPPSQP